MSRLSVLLWAVLICAVENGIVLGLVYAHVALNERSNALVTSLYDNDRNPDMITESEWQAMTWEQKVECKSKFYEGLDRQLQKAEWLRAIAGASVVAISFSVFAATAILVSLFESRKDIPCDAPAR